MKLHLDWSAYENSGQGDAYAGIPSHGGDFAKAVAVCIRDQLCQRKPKGVMCPSFRVTDDPAHSPGGRVDILKAALNGQLDGLTAEAALASAPVEAALSLCVGCKGCQRECANSVDMAAIKIEVQAQRNQQRGVPLRDRLFAGLPRWLSVRPLFARLVAWRNRYRGLAWLGERFLGIAASRRLPEPSPQPFDAAQAETVYRVDSGPSQSPRPIRYEQSAQFAMSRSPECHEQHSWSGTAHTQQRNDAHERCYA